MDEGGELGGRLIQETQKAATKAMVAAGQAAVAMTYGLLALVAGVAAAIMATIALVGKVTGEILSLLSASLRAAIPMLVRAAPQLAEVIFVGLALLAGLWSGVQLWSAFIPLGYAAWAAVGVVLCGALAPLLLIYASNRNAGTAALAAACSLAIGWIVARLPLLILGAVLGGLYLWIILTLWNNTQGAEREREQDTGDRDDYHPGDTDAFSGGDEYRFHEVDTAGDPG